MKLYLSHRVIFKKKSRHFRTNLMKLCNSRPTNSQGERREETEKVKTYHKNTWDWTTHISLIMRLITLFTYHGIFYYSWYSFRFKSVSIWNFTNHHVLAHYYFMNTLSWTSAACFQPVYHHFEYRHERNPVCLSSEHLNVILRTFSQKKTKTNSA